MENQKHQAKNCNPVMKRIPPLKNKAIIKSKYYHQLFGSITHGQNRHPNNPSKFAAFRCHNIGRSETARMSTASVVRRLYSLLGAKVGEVASPSPPSRLRGLPARAWNLPPHQPSDFLLCITTREAWRCRTYFLFYPPSYYLYTYVPVAAPLLRPLVPYPNCGPDLLPPPTLRHKQVHHRHLPKNHTRSVYPIECSTNSERSQPRSQIWSADLWGKKYIPLSTKVFLITNNCNNCRRR